MDELKPCPFCGCTQVLVSQRDGVPLIACNECWGENRTIKAWNRREEVTALEAEVERLKTKFNEERESAFRRYCVSAEAYEKEAIRLKETIKTAHADGASALIASFENVDPKARICELEAEVARLKEAVKRLPEFTWKAERYKEVCDVLKRPQGEDVVGMVESISKEWEQLRSGTTISVEQAKEASQLASQDAAVHTVRACARWLRENGWHNSVRDTAIEMERLMVEDINRTYGTPDMCVPSKVKEGIHYLKVSKPEFDKLCARVEALEQKSSLAVEWERRRIVAYIRNIGGDDYRTVISPQRLAEEIENGNHWK
jgi:cell division septum initiation protein DivIVA